MVHGNPPSLSPILPFRSPLSPIAFLKNTLSAHAIAVLGLSFKIPNVSRFLHAMKT